MSSLKFEIIIMITKLDQLCLRRHREIHFLINSLSTFILHLPVQYLPNKCIVSEGSISNQSDLQLDINCKLFLLYIFVKY